VAAVSARSARNLRVVGPSRSSQVAHDALGEVARAADAEHDLELGAPIHL
jgi:hypothetical protein